MNVKYKNNKPYKLPGNHDPGEPGSILGYAGDNMVLENIIGETSDSTGMDTEDHIRSTKSVTVHDDVIILDNTDVDIQSGKMSNTGLEIVDDIIASADTKEFTKSDLSTNGVVDMIANHLAVVIKKDDHVNTLEMFR